MSIGGERRVLDRAHGTGAMTWVLGIMLFLTVLAAALGLGTLATRKLLDRQLQGRLTVQLVEADPAARTVDTARLLAALRASRDVAAAAAVDRGELAGLLRPWLGEASDDADLPVPVLIDADLASGGNPDRVRAAVARAVPGARMDAHAAWMSPVSALMRWVTWLAAALVLLMAGATAAVVMLAARAGLDQHRGTIEVMHMLGSTDLQVARLFQRRIARDALLGGVLGAGAALVVVALIGRELAGLGSALMGGVSLGTGGWAALALLPIAFVLLATAAARWAITASLRRVL